MSGTKPIDAAKRFWRHVAAGPGDCWVWTGAKARGYGRFSPVHGKTAFAHRWSYEHHIGPIPAGLVIDHLCRNRACVHPHHLEVVTQRENLLRGQTLTAANASRTHCPAGHPYSEENTGHYGSRKYRACRTCAREKTAARRKRALYPHIELRLT